MEYLLFSGYSCLMFKKYKEIHRYFFVTFAT